MHAEYVGNLIEPLDFIKFRELAKHCIELRGYTRPSDSDGWADGGRDVRVYLAAGTNPARIAFQTSVERDWKSKLLADVKKARKKLDCPTFVYITNRRIGDAEFEPVKSKALTEHTVSLSKIDKQDIAQQMIDQEQLPWLFDLVGLPGVLPPPTPTSLRQEVADAFILFSADVTDFRRSMIDHAVLTVLAYSDWLFKEDLIARAQGALDLTDPDRFASAVDRLQQQGRLVHEAGRFRLIENERQRRHAARLLIANEWDRFSNAVREVLAQHVPPRRGDLDDATKAVAERIGRIVHAYRDYQSALLGRDPNQRDVNRRYLSELSSISAVLHQSGVPEDRISQCMEQLTELERSHDVVSRLTAGEVFRKLTPRDGSVLLNALGRATGISMYIEPSVLIPFLCTRLYGDRGGNRFLRGANRLYDAAIGMNVKFMVPDVYLEECSTHLIDAGNYKRIVESKELGELIYSENAFVAYYAAMNDRNMPFSGFLDSFGYRTDRTDFPDRLDAVQASVSGLLRRYRMQVARVRRHRSDTLVRRVAEQDLTHIFQQLGISRPGILVRHDVRVLTFVRESCSEGSEATVLVTWDKTLQAACQGDQYEWWCLDPIHATDLLSLGRPGSQGCLGTEVALLMDNEELVRASRLWDSLVSIEKGDLLDAALFKQAASFRASYLQKQEGDTASTGRLNEAWKEWKAASA